MTSIKERQAQKAASISLDDTDATQSVPRSEPRTAPGQLMNLQGKYAQALDDNKKLQDLLLSTTPNELLISDLHEVKERRRKLSEEEFLELQENLRHNPLVTPITVRKRVNGGFEIISGHNRVRAFQNLGRDKILAVVMESDDDQADLSAFYANLLQPNLPDFEKYLGFKMIQAKRPEMTHAQIAEGSGKSRQLITSLMAFDELSPASMDLLKSKPSAIGANAAAAFGKLIRQGKEQQVENAIQRVISGELDQAQGVKAAQESPVKKAQTEKSLPIKIKSGRSPYCELRCVDKVMRVAFNSAEEAEAITEMIKVLLQERANKAKGE